MSAEKPVYLILGAAGSGRREVVADLIAKHDAWWKECRPLMVNENVAGPAENPFKVMYREQTGK